MSRVMAFMGLLTMMAATIAATSAPTTSQADDGETAGLQLTVSAIHDDKGSFGTRIRIVMKNTSSSDPEVGAARLFEGIQIEIKGPDGAKVPLTIFGKMIALRTVVRSGWTPHEVLKAGAQWEATYDVSRLFDMSVSGSYRIRVSRSIETLGARKSIISNLVEIEVPEPTDDSFKLIGKKD